MNPSIALNSDDIIQIIAIVGGLIIAAIAIITATIRHNAKVREREQTKRELSAYVAEGSMSAEDAEKLLKAGRKGEGSCGG